MKRDGQAATGNSCNDIGLVPASPKNDAHPVSLVSGVGKGDESGEAGRDRIPDQVRNGRLRSQKREKGSSP